MSDRPSQQNVEKHLAIIAKLREVDTTGAHAALCDREELVWRRLAMDGYPQCEGGGIAMPASSQAMVTLLGIDPEAYFDALEPFRPKFLDLANPKTRGAVTYSDAPTVSRKILRALCRHLPTILHSRHGGYAQRHRST